MLKKIGLGFAALIVIVLGLAALQPKDYVITRKITISAPAERIFPYLNNQKLAEKWGPWAKVDPQAKMVYSGPDEGPGAKTSWDTGGQLGTGSATITEVEPLRRVGIALDYTRPMEMHQHSDYILESQGGQSVVTWRVTGQNSFPGRIACLFMNMDKTVGKFFEMGLSNLKTLIESQTQSDGAAK